MVECITDARIEKVENGAAAPRRICFVCTGNTCRSPMAEAVANAMAAEEMATLPAAVRELMTPPWEAFSAGLYAAEGEPIAANAVRALEEAGVAPVASRDYHAHTAHTLSAEEAERADLLVAMSGGHAMELMMRFPHLAQRVTCMPQAISDPYGGDLARYAACLREITEGVRTLLSSGGGT